jgi:hypothetical protein
MKGRYIMYEVHYENSVFFTKMLIQIFVRFDFLLIYGKHLDDRIFSLRVALWVYSTSLTRQRFIEVLVPSQEIERGNIYVH